MLLNQRPIEPGNFVVLTEGVVVSTLAAPHLVSHQQHRRAGRQQGQAKGVLDLAIAQPFDLGIGRRTFDAAVPAEIMVASITVSFAIRLVVLVVERNEVIERKAVVAGYKIDALFRLPLFLLVDIGAPG